MGLHIGIAVAGLNTAQTAVPGTGVSNRSTTSLGNVGVGGTGASEPSIPPDRVGFGEGTVSVPGVAIRAIDRNLKQSGEIVRTLQEVRKSLREHSADQANQQQLGQIQIDLHNASAQTGARTHPILNDLNTAPGVSLTPTHSEPPPGTANGLDIRVGDQTINLKKIANQPTLNIVA